METNNEDFELRLLKREDIRLLKRETDKEGWCDKLDFMFECYENNPDTYYGLFAKDGRLISTCQGIPLTDNIAAIAEFLTVREFRGRRYGKLVFEAVVKALGNRIIYLNALHAAIPMYVNRWRFSKTCLEGFMQCGILRLADVYKKLENVDLGTTKIEFVDKKEDVIDEIIDYDSSICSFERRRYVRNWIMKEDYLAVLARDSAGKIIGWAGVRATLETGYRLSPVYASCDKLARILFLNILTKLKDGIDVETYGIVRDDGLLDVISELFSNATNITRFTGLRSEGAEDLKHDYDKVYALFNVEETII
ncbi:DgyrCDS181 [Dimorphilus gyrociliatus]|uniref:DgyrCDS181 n=1 Tax=Dimorphilus gyrociliatus TaxID=2664684 RepID=A0A7I8V5J2_9ANNE|nr:DgyrCDS181 [Dimorphilus gyrociliatus]